MKQTCCALNNQNQIDTNFVSKEKYIANRLMKNTNMIVVKAVHSKKGVVQHTVHSGQLSQKTVN